MDLAGVSISDSMVLQLGHLLRQAGFTRTAEELEIAYDATRPSFGITAAGREAILGALDGHRDDFHELYGVLRDEDEWRRREGL
jgi:hypothetical protein